MSAVIRAPRRVVVGSAIVSLLVIGLTTGGIADAHHAARGANTAKIKMVEKKKDLFFKGPKTVEQGQELQIVNKTNPKKVGPHTFSLVQKKLRPKVRKNEHKTGKHCFEPGGICLAIAIAHKFDPSTNQINKPVVETGKKGWDHQFTKNGKGDSWYTETKDERNTRKVSAKAGTTLFYMCAVHPWMQGKVKVVK